MTKTIVKMLMCACFCFDLHAGAYVDSNVSVGRGDLGGVFKTQVKNPDAVPVTCAIRLFCESTNVDGSIEWKPIKPGDSADYVLDVVGGGRESLHVDLLKVLKSQYGAAQKIKAEFTVKSVDTSGKEVVDTFFREYSLDSK